MRCSSVACSCSERCTRGFPCRRRCESGGWIQGWRPRGHRQSLHVQRKAPATWPLARARRGYCARRASLHCLGKPRIRPSSTWRRQRQRRWAGRPSCPRGEPASPRRCRSYPPRDCAHAAFVVPFRMAPQVCPQRQGTAGSFGSFGRLKGTCVTNSTSSAVTRACSEEGFGVRVMKITPSPTRGDEEFDLQAGNPLYGSRPVFDH